MTKTIFVVDDDVHVRGLLTMVLERQQFVVCAAEHPLEALKLLETNCPDLMILDYMMPRMSGVDFCRVLRERRDTEHLPILMLSARSDSTTRQAGLDAGANVYLTKPVNHQRLVQEISMLLETGTSHVLA